MTCMCDDLDAKDIYIDVFYDEAWPARGVSVVAARRPVVVATSPWPGWRPLVTCMCGHLDTQDIYTDVFYDEAWPPGVGSPRPDDGDPLACVIVRLVEWRTA